MYPLLYHVAKLESASLMIRYYQYIAYADVGLPACTLPSPFCAWPRLVCGRARTRRLYFVSRLSTQQVMNSSVAFKIICWHTKEFHNRLVGFSFLLFGGCWNRVSSCSSDYSGTHCVDQAAPDSQKIHLPLPPSCFLLVFRLGFLCDSWQPCFTEGLYINSKLAQWHTPVIPAT